MTAREIGKKILLVIACLAALAISAPAYAEPSNSVDSASRNQRAWGQLSEDQKNELRNAYKRWKAMPSDQKQQLSERYERFRALSPTEKQRVVRLYHWFKNQPSDRQSRLRERLREVQQLPADRREKFWQRLKDRRERRNGAGRFLRGRRRFQK
jgi:hypothetical protein